MIANPQILKRLGHFLTTDFKSVGAPSGGIYPHNPLNFSVLCHFL